MTLSDKMVDVVIEIQIYEKYGDGFSAQDKYLVRGTDDVLWTDEIEHVISYVKWELERIERLRIE